MIYHANPQSLIALKKMFSGFGLDVDSLVRYNSFSLPALECDLGFQIVEEENHGKQDSQGGMLNDQFDRLDSILANFHRSKETQVSQLEAASILTGTCACEILTWTCGLDFVLEHRNSRPLIIEASYPNVYAFLIRISGDNHGLIRENHSFGYHFHYAQIRSRTRTNVLFTFDKDLRDSVPPLFWEFHSGDTRTDPSRFGAGRRRAIYDAATPSLTNPGLAHFCKPGKASEILYPTN